jgi:predicted XRE-type DNA-binding protein
MTNRRIVSCHQALTNPPSHQRRANHRHPRARRRRLIFCAACWRARGEKKKVRVTKSSGNVFADIGLPNAAERSIKADLVMAIADRIKSKGLTQVEATSLLGLAQSDVSKLLRGHFAGYSYERLFGYHIALGRKVRIEVSEARTKKEARLELEMTG